MNYYERLFLEKTSARVGDGPGQITLVQLAQRLGHKSHTGVMRTLKLEKGSPKLETVGKIEKALGLREGGLLSDPASASDLFPGMPPEVAEYLRNLGTQEDWQALEILLKAAAGFGAQPAANAGASPKAKKTGTP